MHNVQWGLYNVQGGLQGEQHDAVQHNHHSEISQSASQHQLAKHKLGTTWVGNLGEVIHKECYRGLFKLFTFSLLSTHQTYVSKLCLYWPHIKDNFVSGYGLAQYQEERLLLFFFGANATAAMPWRPGLKLETTSCERQ